MNQEVVSFVLRFVREEGANQPARWRGVIKHVQSDQAADFSRFGDALAFMQAHVDDAIRQAFSGQEPLTPDRMLAETARLWGEMAPRYTDMMLQSMQMWQSFAENAFTEKMGRWGLPARQDAPAASDPLLDAVERLAAQVDALTAKVEALEARLSGEE